MHNKPYSSQPTASKRERSIYIQNGHVLSCTLVPKELRFDKREKSLSDINIIHGEVVNGAEIDGTVELLEVGRNRLEGTHLRRANGLNNRLRHGVEREVLGRGVHLRGLNEGAVILDGGVGLDRNGLERNRKDRNRNFGRSGRRNISGLEGIDEGWLDRSWRAGILCDDGSNDLRLRDRLDRWNGIHLQDWIRWNGNGWLRGKVHVGNRRRDGDDRNVLVS